MGFIINGMHLVLYLNKKELMLLVVKLFMDYGKSIYLAIWGQKYSNERCSLTHQEFPLTKNNMTAEGHRTVVRARRCLDGSDP